MRDQLLNESWLSRFHFAVWIFVSELALFCTSNFQLLTDVYNHRFWCRFKEQIYFLNESAVCSEIFTVLKLIVGLLNICTKTLLQLGNLKHIFWFEFATESFFQEILLLVNVKLTLRCCHCAVRARPRRRYLISIVFECLNSKLLTSISWAPRFFSESFFSCWCLIHVQLFSNVIFGLGQGFTSNVELRSKDYKHFCYKLREMWHFEKDFGFEAVWDLRYCFITWFWAQPTCTKHDWFNWNCAFWCEIAKMRPFQYVTFLSCWTCAHLFSNMGCKFRLVGQFFSQG